MQVRQITGTPRRRFQVVRRVFMAVLRWTFIAIGALAAATVMFSFIYRANAQVYDPSMFAIGVGGLFAMACGIILMMLSRNSRLRMELRHARIRCEELADGTWELKETEARATSLLEAQGDVIVRRDRDGRITYANDAYCTLAGQPREALIGTKSTLPSLQEGRSSVLIDGTRLHDEQIATPDGPRWLSWRNVVVWDEKAEFAEVQSVGRDVSDRIEAEQALAEARDAAEAANRAKSSFLAMVSHEIRTPLNGILGMAGLLADTPLTPEQATYVKATRTSGDALLSLIEEVLDFSKIEAGKLELEAQPVALGALVEDVAELLAPRAQAKGLEIASDVDESLPERVIGDPARLRQVLLNLAGNAIKFTESGGVGIVVEPGVQRGHIAIEVRDSGIGIAPEQHDRIFHEFEQADDGAARKFGGTGLGLAISRRIVERMNGSITVESAPGQGSTFRASLPLPEVDAETPSPAIQPDLSGMSVLIVAPAGIEASLIERRLTRWRADAMHLAPHLVDMFAQRQWDAALVDLSSGPQAAALATGADIARRIVLITPGERHRLPALKAAGFTGYLVKPVRGASLFGQLTGSADAHAAEQAEDAAPAADVPQRHLSVLVAEDNEINALLTRSLLARMGHRSIVQQSGAAVLESWNRARDAGVPYDLVLMDLHMPGLDGLEAARRIRATEAEQGARRTPIIALTANAFAEDREACLDAGMDGFLTKPLDREKLAAAIADVAKPAEMAA
jgi:PAS domain S-box-containing protein